MPKPISRKEAKRLGLIRYFTGKPCRYGHVAERSTGSKYCLECHRIRRQRVRAASPERIKAQKAASYQRHRDRAAATGRLWWAANRERMNERRRKQPSQE